MTTSTDDLYARPDVNLVDFAFDQRVVDVFPDMIRRSVPAYETVVPMSALVAAHSLAALSGEDAQDALVYDLGCSRGATTAALLTYCPSPIKIVGVDNSAPMIEAARQSIAGLTSEANAQRASFQCEDIRSAHLEAARAVLMNYTLQFIPPSQREAQLTRIYQALLPGAPLIYAEKVVLDDPLQQEWANAIHLDFKRANGYSELEVARKRSAIEHVMIPESIETHIERLQRLGYAQVRVWFSCLNWAAFIGFRPSGTDQ